jgi:hypothetical protein
MANREIIGRHRKNGAREDIAGEWIKRQKRDKATACKKPKNAKGNISTLLETSGLTGSTNG